MIEDGADSNENQREHEGNERIGEGTVASSWRRGSEPKTEQPDEQKGNIG